MFLSFLLTKVRIQHYYHAVLLEAMDVFVTGDV